MLRGMFKALLARQASMAGEPLVNGIAFALSGDAAIRSFAGQRASHRGIRSWRSADRPLLAPVITVNVPWP